MNVAPKDGTLIKTRHGYARWSGESWDKLEKSSAPDPEEWHPLDWPQRRHKLTIDESIGTDGQKKYFVYPDAPENATAFDVDNFHVCYTKRAVIALMEKLID